MHEALTAVLSQAYGLHHVALRDIDDGSRPVCLVDAVGGRFVVKCYGADRESIEALARRRRGVPRVRRASGADEHQGPVPMAMIFHGWLGAFLPR